MKIEIKHRYTLAVIFETEAETLRQAVEQAVAKRVDLSYSDLSYSNLRGAKIAEDITVSRAPIQISGLHWPITIWDAHMRIGCKFYAHAEWFNFDDDTIAAMDYRAAEFWNAHRGHLLSLCQFHASQCTGD